MEITNEAKWLFFLSSIMMAIAIIIGAFGAHELKDQLNEYGTIIYSKASGYQFYNTLGLFVISIIYVFIKSKKVKVSFYFVLIGMLIFSFSLYILAISKILWLGAITPIGGLLMIVGWLILAYSILIDMKYKT